MILTLGMIVKNEEKYLEQCLNGIKPILDNVDSELIITDTGSTDRTVEIAHKFTDKVLHFDWINDFAAARNFGLKKAQGEWFMFLDADNIFESCDEIISFFNSGEYKNYSAATYISRSLTDTENGYFDFNESRMTRIYPDTMFVGAVHEYLTHYVHPIKVINDVALHYGYLFDNKEQAQKKAMRNINILQSMLEHDKQHNPLIFRQLYDSYKMYGDMDTAVAYLDKGIEYCKKIRSPYIASYYISKIKNTLNKSYKQTLELCDEYFSLDKSIRGEGLTTDIEIYAIQASVLYDHLNFSEAKEAFANYFDIYEDVRTGKLNTDDASALLFAASLKKNYIDQLNSFIECCIICKDYNTALRYLSSLPVSKYSLCVDDVNVLIDKIITVLENIGYENGYEIYTRLDEYGQNVLIGNFIKALYHSDNKAVLIDLLKKIGSDIPWLKQKTELYENYFIKDIFPADQLCNYIEKFGTNNDPDLLKLSLDKNTDISCFFKADDFNAKHCVFSCGRNIEGFYDAAENYNISNISDSNVLPAAAKLYDYCISMRLMDNEDKTEEEKKQLIGKLFKIKNELNERYKRENSAKSEFELLAETVKKNIRSFIAKGDIDAARKTLEDYKKINPGDPEISDISEEIRGTE